MKILFLSHYFPPEINAPATRTYEHCKQWVKMGHEVTVVSCVPHHPMGKVYPGYRNKRFYSVERKDGIKAIKVFTYITANEGFIKRSWNYFFYMIMAIAVAPLLPRADIVISTSPQFFNGLAGYFVARLKRCPWVLEIRDLWPESILAVGALRNQRLIGCLEAIERFVYRKADYIVAVSNSYKSHILARGGSAEKITVIRNGVDLKFFQPRAADAAFAEQIGVGGKFVAAYVGTHGLAHGLDTLLEAAQQLRQRHDIVLVMAGDGAERERLQSRVREQGLENVKMLGQLPKEDMPRLWSLTRASLVLLKKTDLFLSVIPSKIFESMAMQVPIVLGVRGESQEIIEQARSGLCIEPQSAAELAAAIRRLADSPPLCRQLGENGRRQVEQEFNREALARRYEQVLTGLACGGAGIGQESR